MPRGRSRTASSGFDSATGLGRVRYASTAPHGAARDRYRDTGSYIPADHAGHYLVTLTGELRVVDLRRERTLDALGVDDRVSTGHEPEAWEAAQHLSDLVREWWGDAVHGIAYRPRTPPETSVNVAFFAHAPLRGRSIRLDRARRLADELVVRYEFTSTSDPPRRGFLWAVDRGARPGPAGQCRREPPRSSRRRGGRSMPVNLGHYPPWAPPVTLLFWLRAPPEACGGPTAGGESDDRLRCDRGDRDFPGPWIRSWRLPSEANVGEE